MHIHSWRPIKRCKYAAYSSFEENVSLRTYALRVKLQLWHFFARCLKIKSLHLRADSLKWATLLACQLDINSSCLAQQSGHSLALQRTLSFKQLTNGLSLKSFLILLFCCCCPQLFPIFFYHLLCVLLSLRVYNFMLRLIAMVKNAHRHTHLRTNISEGKNVAKIMWEKEIYKKCAKAAKIPETI